MDTKRIVWVTFIRLSLSLFPRSLDLLSFPLALLPVSRLPYCRGREAVPRTIFLRKAIQMPKNASAERYTTGLCIYPPKLRAARIRPEVKGRVCFMDGTYTYIGFGST